MACPPGGARLLLRELFDAPVRRGAVRRRGSRVDHGAWFWLAPGPAGERHREPGRWIARWEGGRSSVLARRLAPAGGGVSSVDASDIRDRRRGPGLPLFGRVLRGHGRGRTHDANSRPLRPLSVREREHIHLCGIKGAPSLDQHAAASREPIRTEATFEVVYSDLRQSSFGGARSGWAWTSPLRMTSRSSVPDCLSESGRFRGGARPSRHGCLDSPCASSPITGASSVEKART